MAFEKKEWKDRLVEFAGRRKLNNTATGESTVVDVERAEGQVSQAGDAFSAENMNDLEQRIADGFEVMNSNLGGLSFTVLTQAEYDALPGERKDPKTLYFITEG